MLRLLPLLFLFCVAIRAAPPGFPMPSLPEGEVTGERCTKLLCNLGGRSEHGYDWKILRETEAFKRFLAQRGVADLSKQSKEERRKLEVQFLREALTRLDESLSELQSASLRNELKSRGAAGNAQDGYVLLQGVSTENRKRLTPPDATDARRKLPKPAREALDRLGLALFHNAHIPPRVDDISHLLSSYRLGELGLDGGYNTNSFNRDYVKSSDNCFFNVAVTRRGREGELTSSEYGNHGVAPNDTFARKRGWISSYVMWPNELMDLIARADPALYGEISELIAKEYPEDTKVIEANMEKNQRIRPARAVGRWLDPTFTEGVAGSFFNAHPELASRIQGLQHRFDFTPEDFSGLIQDRAAVRLSQLYATDPKAYAEALEAVKNGSVYKLVFQDEDLPNQFEFKIPVGIPTTEIGRRW